jgi:hypothetical protein
VKVSLPNNCMAQSDFQYFTPREYLETYYPNDINPEYFLKAIQQISSIYEDTVNSKILDIGAFSKKTGLDSEVLENAAIFDFFLDLATLFLKVFPRGDARVLDIGGGPTIYQHLSFSLIAESIIHAEYLKENRKEIAAYVTNHEEAYSWESYFYAVKNLFRADCHFQDALQFLSSHSDIKVQKNIETIQHILKTETEISEYENFVKKKIAQRLVSCDVFQKDLEFDEKKMIQYYLSEDGQTKKPNIITSYFVTESATSDYETWKEGLHNIVHNLESGGYFVLAAIRNAEWYKVGNHKIKALSVNEKDIQRELGCLNITLIDMRVLVGSDAEQDGYEGMILACFQKK